MTKAKYLLVTVILAAGLSAQARHKGSGISILSIKRDIFYFKVGTTFCGAQIEVFSADGTRILSEKVTRHKAIIDFYYENPGHYTIKISKGDKTEEFIYDKTTPSPYEEIGAAFHISMNQ